MDILVSRTLYMSCQAGQLYDFNLYIFCDDLYGVFVLIIYQKMFVYFLEESHLNYLEITIQNTLQLFALYK